MKILITGANGLLGQHLVKLFVEQGFPVLATGRGACRVNGISSYLDADITDEQLIGKWIAEHRPEVVVHAAAMTQVDACEQDPVQCSAVNVQATEDLLMHAAKYSKLFVYVSTDFIFDGENGFYEEEDPAAPVNWYGSTKLQAEQKVKGASIPWSIVRTCLVYGDVITGTRTNIINWVRDNLANKQKIKVVSDQYRTPTYVEDLARGILLIVERKQEGIFHISGEEIFTPYEMALRTADFFGLDKTLIEKADAAYFTQPGRRPLKTGFNIEKAKQLLGYKPISFREGLGRMRY